MLSFAKGAWCAAGMTWAVTRSRVTGRGSVTPGHRYRRIVSLSVPPPHPPAAGPPFGPAPGPGPGPDPGPAYTTQLPAIPPVVPPPAPVYDEPRPLAPGQLTPGWRNLLIVGWIGVILGLAAVWKSSWTLGFPTWWLGPQEDPRFPPLLVLPFVLPMVVVVNAIRNTRYTAIVGIFASVVAQNIAWGDVGHQIKLAVVEFALAAAGLAISAASLAGMVRPDRGDSDAGAADGATADVRAVTVVPTNTVTIAPPGTEPTRSNEAVS